MKLAIHRTSEFFWQ